MSAMHGSYGDTHIYIPSLKAPGLMLAYERLPPPSLGPAHPYLGAMVPVAARLAAGFRFRV